MFATAAQRLTDLTAQLGDVPRRIADDQYAHLSSLLSESKESFNLTRRSQEELLQQLDNVDRALAELNKLLRKNFQEKLHLQAADHEEIDHRAQLMMLNAEALECRAAAVQLQQQAKLIVARANEMERRTNEQLVEPIPPVKSTSASVDEKTKQSEVKNTDERRTPTLAKEKKENASKIVPKTFTVEHEYNRWPMRE